ncbi:TolC family protein, partial [Novosphingobium sp.]|uniref:TolC family protein n=1 Tax=Novosphingobium sp. TaxID=1874826 RepID=UPI002633C5A9
MAFLLVLSCAGCAPEARLASAPPVEAAGWSEGADSLTAERPAVPADIAMLLGSPELASLTATALARNTDIAIAAAGVERAAALLREARLAAFPAVSLSTSANRSFARAGSSLDFRDAAASLDIDWNLDPFGRIGGAKSAALARTRAA